MCRIGDYNLSQASLTSPEALGRLRRLRDENPALHAELTQTTPDTSVAPASEIEEEAFTDVDVHDDSDIPLAVISSLLTSGPASLAAEFAAGPTGGLVRTGDAEQSDTEAGPAPAPVTLGRGQRKKIGTSRYQGPFWEEH
ncbi:hypothetical protein C8R46DRAFT_1041562 [Mycena filopes]|nr:hypothetical protein C8R46DRAFT_1041562 [Mycena filopes]